MAPSDSRVLYLQLAQGRFQGSTDGVLGIFRSSDGGDHWVDVAGTRFRADGPKYVNNTIAVHPTEPDHVLCGGVELHRTINGGTSWRKVSRWDAEPGQSNYAHADQHGLLMPAARPGLVYAANDGGLDVSENGGRNLGQSQRRAGGDHVLRSRGGPIRIAASSAAGARTMGPTSPSPATRASISRSPVAMVAGW